VTVPLGAVHPDKGVGGRGTRSLARLVYARTAGGPPSAIRALFGRRTCTARNPRRRSKENAANPNLSDEIGAGGRRHDRHEKPFAARRAPAMAAEDASPCCWSERATTPMTVEPEVGEGEAPKALCEGVSPGQRFALGKDPLRLVDRPVATRSRDGLGGPEALDLKTGQPGRAGGVGSAAEGRAVAAVQKRGYAIVKTQPREAGG